MPRTAFVPHVHGFAFVNSWEFDEVEQEELRRIFDDRLDKIRASGGAVFGRLAALLVGRAIKPIRERLEEGLKPGYGLCGGMAYAALDFFKAGVPTPRGEGPRDWPASASPLRNYIWKRQLKSFFVDVDRFLIWMIYLNNIPPQWPFRGGPGWLVRESREEWKKLKGFVDAGNPVPLGLVRNTAYVFDNHQVLAIGYDQEGQNQGTIYLYDPNCPSKESTLRIGFGGDALQVEESCVAAQELRGFFCEEYEFVEPTGALA